MGVVAVVAVVSGHDGLGDAAAEMLVTVAWLGQAVVVVVAVGGVVAVLVLVVIGAVVVSAVVVVNCLCSNRNYSCSLRTDGDKALPCNFCC